MAHRLMLAAPSIDDAVSIEICTIRSFRGQYCAVGSRQKVGPGLPDSWPPASLLVPIEAAGAGSGNNTYEDLTSHASECAQHTRTQTHTNFAGASARKDRPRPARRGRSSLALPAFLRLGFCGRRRYTPHTRKGTQTYIHTHTQIRTHTHTHTHTYTR